MNEAGDFPSQGLCHCGEIPPTCLACEKGCDVSHIGWRISAMPVSDESGNLPVSAKALGVGQPVILWPAIEIEE